MLRFNPCNFGLKDVKRVEICFITENGIKQIGMNKIENRFEISKKICNKYIGYYFKIENRIYYTYKIDFAVIATMSSGKSTFINSILGRNIMPSENMACTAKIFKIENTFGKQVEDITYRDEGKIKRYFLDRDYIDELNKIEIVGDINLKLKYDTLDSPVVLYDTPGVNNSADITHKDVTYEFLKSRKISNLIYIINATQIGTTDDEQFLIDIAKINRELKKNFKILFIINKIDAIDEEVENINDIVNNVKNYLKNNGFENYEVLKLSAYKAKILRLALSNMELTRTEKSNLKNWYELDYGYIRETNKDMIKVGPIEYCKDKLNKMLGETGILDIEFQLQNINKFDKSFSLKRF